MERWGSRQCCTFAKRSADSWEPLLISYFCIYWQHCRMTGTAMKPLSRSPGASGEAAHTAWPQFIQDKELQRRKGYWYGGNSIINVGLVRERKIERACAFFVSAHICIRCSLSGISQGHAGKVCQSERRRRVEISRESVSSTALVLVAGAAGLRLILLIGLRADCCTASLIC